MSTTDRPGIDRPTATYPTDPAAIWADPAGYPTDWLADRTPTATYPTGYPRHERAAQPAPFVRTKAAPHVTTNALQNEGAVQDMWRPRWLPAWHPSLMQLAIGAALVLALLGACNVAAIQAHRAARAHCHALVVRDWQAATRECRGTGSAAPAPEQIPSSPHTPSPAPSGAPSPSTPPPFTRVNSPSPSTQPSSSPQAAPTWVTRDTGAAYDRTDPSASPLSLPRCTTSPSTPLPCLASLSPDGSRAVVLEEDASLTGLVRR